MEWILGGIVTFGLGVMAVYGLLWLVMRVINACSRDEEAQLEERAPSGAQPMWSDQYPPGHDDFTVRVGSGWETRRGEANRQFSKQARREPEKAKLLTGGTKWRDE